MTDPAKATLQILNDADGGTRKHRTKDVRRQGDPVAVQLNPTSLRLQRNNNVDRGGVSTGTPRRQNATTERAVLTFDLEFDTADAGTDVRDLTGLVTKFTEPSKENPGNAPPRVEFQWGTLIFRGIITQVTEDLDYFSVNGIPLRAKVSVSIQEQDLRFEKGQNGPAARTAVNSSPFGRVPTTMPAGRTPPSGAEPGQRGERDVRREVRALAGESVQQLATRLGGDPAAWRSLMNDLDSPLNLEAGATVQVGPAIDRASGLGLASGVAARLPATATAALASALEPQGAAADAGFTLTAAGGVRAAASRLASDQVERAVSGARGAFRIPSAGAPIQTPSGAVEVTVDVDVDPRSLTYGASIPLVARPIVRVSAEPLLIRRVVASAGEERADAEQRRRDATTRTIRTRPGR